MALEIVDLCCDGQGRFLVAACELLVVAHGI